MRSELYGPMHIVTQEGDATDSMFKRLNEIFRQEVVYDNEIMGAHLDWPTFL